MPENKGKSFEKRFSEDWKRSFPDSFLLRLNDQLSGYLTVSSNPCDFICMPYSELFLIECKSHKGSSISFDVIPQYERMLEYRHMPNIRPGVIVWFYEKDRVVWVPLSSMIAMHKDGEKSIKLSKLDSGCYDFIEIPSKKLRTFMQSDYTVLTNTDVAYIE